MGIVYEAEHVALGRSVAVKIVAPELATDLTFRERFLREARLAAALEHPAIIPIYDAGEADGVVYIAMRRVHGGDLSAQLTAGGPMHGRRVLEIMRPIASALDAAHRRHLVHRDVKPQNILVEPPSDESDEHVFLTDFGLTKRTDDSGGLTKTGMFVGTFRYAAPEQFQGTELDGRTDQYALACVAQQCLTGSPPFAGDTDPQVMYGHLAAPPPPVTALRPDLPAAVDEVFRRALAKTKEERFPTCGDFVVALDGALGGRAPRPDDADPTRVAPPPAPHPPTVVAPPPPSPIASTRAAPAPQPPVWEGAPPAPVARTPAGVSPDWAPPAGPLAGAPVVPGRGRKSMSSILVGAGAAVALLTAALSNEPGLVFLVFVVPPALLAFALSVARSRGPRIAWGVIALLVGLFSLVVGGLASVNGSPDAIPLVPGGGLVVAGAIRALMHAPPAPTSGYGAQRSPPSPR
jgi:serine/threonine-protein kinase